jgi:hypothetical protein
MDEVRTDMEDMQRSEAFEVIAAFADGERVDARALRAALADEAARDYLIDLVAMRVITRTTDVGVVAAASSATGSNRRLWTGLAAAVALAVGLAGYAIGQRNSPVERVAFRAPLEADVVVSTEVPPEPTQVIRLGAEQSGARGR